MNTEQERNLIAFPLTPSSRILTFTQFKPTESCIHKTKVSVVITMSLRLPFFSLLNSIEVAKNEEKHYMKKQSHLPKISLTLSYSLNFSDFLFPYCSRWQCIPLVLRKAEENLQLQSRKACFLNYPFLSLYSQTHIKE